MQKKVAVIGGGPGGYVAAIRLAQLGAEVTLIEKHKIGGTCLNYGCIPTKTLYKNAEVLRTLNDAEIFGVTIEGMHVDAGKIAARKNEVVHQLVSGIEQLIKTNGIEVIEGTAAFKGAGELSIQPEEGAAYERTFDDVIIATGSVPSLPPIGGLETEGVVTSKELLDFKEIPKKLIVIGGGVIAMEFACIFSALGAEVEMVIRSDRCLREVDGEIAKRFTASLKKKGITLHKNVQMEQIEKTPEGVRLVGRQKEAPVAFEGDALLVSTGRKPYFEGLNLEGIGVQTEKGIVVDAHYKTSVDHVYAIGDVNGHMLLAHAASHQGITAAEAIMGIEPEGYNDVVPNCIFVFPEIACVGLDEERAKEKGVAIKKSKFPFVANGKALSIDETEGFVKVITDENDIVLGVHIMGPHASDLIHEGALAITQKLHVSEIGKTIHAHPTLGEAFAEASMGILETAIHLAPKKKKKER